MIFIFSLMVTQCFYLRCHERKSSSFCSTLHSCQTPASPCSGLPDCHIPLDSFQVPNVSREFPLSPFVFPSALSFRKYYRFCSFPSLCPANFFSIMNLHLHVTLTEKPFPTSHIKKGHYYPY